MKQQKFTIRQFNQMFPHDDACLDVLRDHIYPDGITCRSCKEVRPHHRLTQRRAYSCDYCGTHVYVLAGTIFAKTTTPLTSWFYAMFLMGSTRCGISAKQLERELGVTYKTAWRMFKQIRSLLDEEPTMLSGEVELDEAWIGGRMRYTGTKSQMAKARYSNKEAVAGQVQRGGRLQAFHLPQGPAGALVPLAQAHILPGSTVYTDELPAYKALGRTGYYEHKRVHHAARVYVSGNAHVNTIEGFWSLLKNGIRGVYHSVSAKYLQSYVDEYVFRYNHRKDNTPMFSLIEGQVRHVRYGRYGRYAPLD